MAVGKDEWKSTGRELGGAFNNLAKSLVRSTVDGVKIAEEWADTQKDEYAGRKPEKSSSQNESTVFNDGSWRKTGKGLGKAFAGLGSTIAGSMERAAGKTEEYEGTVVADAEIISEETI